jgi:N12 class adenine-specific DNA methylase
MEISPDGASLRPRSRFARFTNLPELQQMFLAFADVQTAEMLDLPRPRLQTGKPIVVACPMSDEQHALQYELVERYDKLRSQKVDPRVDNALNITNLDKADRSLSEFHRWYKQGRLIVDPEWQRNYYPGLELGDRGRSPTG